MALTIRDNDNLFERIELIKSNHNIKTNQKAIEKALVVATVDYKNLLSEKYDLMSEFESLQRRYDALILALEQKKKSENYIESLLS